MKIDWQQTFRNLLEEHRKMGYLRDSRIQKILGEIPIEVIFAENQLERFVLMDSPALFYFESPQKARTCSAPHMISMIMSMLEIKPQDRILVLGSKGGLIEATLAKASKDVTILEFDENVAAITEEAFIKLGLKNIWVQNSDPLYGLQEKALYDKILITGAVPFIPEAIFKQLAIQGIIVVPLMINNPNQQVIMQIVKEKAEEYRAINFGGVIFSPLIFPLELHQNEKVILGKELFSRAKTYQNFNEITPFFEEFKEIPKIEMYNLTFNEGRQIFLSKPCPDGLKEELIDLNLILYNPYNHSNSITIQVYSFSSQATIFEEVIEISANTEYDFRFQLKLPLHEGEEHLKIISLQNKYRTGSINTTLYLSHLQDLWDFTLETSEE